MKNTLLFVALLAVTAFVCADDEPTHEYKPPKYPCIFTISIDKTTLLTHNINKVYVNSHFVRVSTINHAGVLVYDKLYRPDIKWEELSQTEEKVTKFNYYTYSAEGGCKNASDIDYKEYEKDFLQYIFGNEDFDLLIHAHTFFNKTKAEFDGNDCTFYFDLDIDHRAYYVNDEGKIIGMVFNRDIPDQRETYKLTWGTKSPYSDYVFKKSFVYNCTDQFLFVEPTKENATCTQ